VAHTNVEVALLLRELARLTELEEGSVQSFRVRAYQRAVDAVRSLETDVTGLSFEELRAVDGIGDRIARKIREYVETGRIGKLEELRSRYPPGMLELLKVPGLGPKTVLMLRDHLGVTDVDGLRAALEGHRVRELPRMGPRSEERLAAALERLGLHSEERRVPIAESMPVAGALVAALEELPGVERAVVCGSLRRFREMIGDVDVVVAAEDPAEVTAAFVALPVVRDVLVRGPTKASVVVLGDLQADLRVVQAEEFGAAVLYATGSKAHNIHLRQLALDRGWTLNEYGLTEVESGRVVASRTEEEIYAAFDLPYIEAPMREDRGEIEAAVDGTLPTLVRLADLRGDLHVHSSWSGDGRSSLEEMLDAAAARGLAYVAITEHAAGLAINGLSRERVLEERDRIGRLAERYPGLRILYGVELNIDPDGGLDYDAGFRAGLDWCVASIHDHFELPAERQTRRLVAAMEDPAVTVIGHPTGRRIGRRRGIEFDLAEVLDAAERTGTALEINGSLERLDLPSDLLMAARGRSGVCFAISSDAHHVADLENVRWGVRTAQRGWVEAPRVVNTWPVERLVAWIRDRVAPPADSGNA